MMILIALSLIAIWGGVQQAIQEKRELTAEEMNADYVRWLNSVSPNKPKTETLNK